MARSGFTTSNFLRYSGGLLTVVPVTMACWVRPATVTGVQVYMNLHNSASTFSRNCFVLYSSTSQVVALAGSASGSSTAITPVNSLVVNTWSHICGVFTTGTSRDVFINGGGKVNNAGSGTPTGINVTGIGVELASTVQSPISGSVAEAGMWNVALTDAEVASLAAGTSPLLVRPSALVGYWPLVGVNSPENNIVGAASVMTVNGALSASAHPRMFDPE